MGAALRAGDGSDVRLDVLLCEPHGSGAELQAPRPRMRRRRLNNRGTNTSLAAFHSSRLACDTSLPCPWGARGSPNKSSTTGGTSCAPSPRAGPDRACLYLQGARLSVCPPRSASALLCLDPQSGLLAQLLFKPHDMHQIDGFFQKSPEDEGHHQPGAASVGIAKVFLIRAVEEVHRLVGLLRHLVHAVKLR